MARINYYEATPEELERHNEATDTGLLSRYAANQPRDSHADEREELEYHYANQKNPRAYDKIVAAGRTAVSAGRSAAGAVSRVVGTGVGREIGQNPHIRQIGSQSGFGAPVSAAPRHPTSRAQYPNAPVAQDSTMHPGNQIYIIRCENGNCKMTSATGRVRTARPARRRPSYVTGGLGGDDPGL